MTTITVQQAFELAVQHHEAGRLADAESLYRQLLAVQPNHPGALHSLGNIAAQVGRVDLAMELFGKAIAAQAYFPEVYDSIGVAFKAKGELDRAIAAFRHAIALKPDFPDAYYNLGNALVAQGQLEEGISAYRQGIALAPNDAQALSNLGKALHDTGRLQEAIAAFRRARVVIPGLPVAWNNLGKALKENEQLDEAITVFRQAVALNPNLPESHDNLGGALAACGLVDEAVAAHRQAIALKPDYSSAVSNLGIVLSNAGQVEEAIATFRQALAIRPDFAEVHSNLLLALHYSSDLDPASIFQEHLRWNRQHCEPLRESIRQHLNDRNPDRRLRIGYVSPDFREHPVGRYVLPLLAHHDRAHYEIFCYAQVKTPDKFTERLRAHADGWRGTLDLSDEKVAEMIRGDQVDILVDLAGHTSHNRLLVFARKPAPIQVTWLGYPDTTGLSTIDYRITDAWADPPGLTDPYSSEQLIRLPQTNWIYEPTDGSDAQVESGNDIQGPIVFGSFNNFAKIQSPTLRLWGRILKAAKGSRLLLKDRSLRSDGLRQRVLAILSEMEITSDRVEFRWERLAWGEYARMCRQTSIALDPFPYDGTATTCDLMWMGVPVVTLAGQTHVSRVGVSLLSNVGLTELIARDSDDYVRIAVELAGNRVRLCDLRATLRQRMLDSPIMNAAQFARNIESAYRQIWQNWCGRSGEAVNGRPL